MPVHLLIGVGAAIMKYISRIQIVQLGQQLYIITPTACESGKKGAHRQYFHTFIYSRINSRVFITIIEDVNIWLLA